MVFKEGMRVRILPREPEWEEEGPSYVDDMMYHANKIITLQKTTLIGGQQYFSYAGYSWLTNWVTLAEMENV